MHPQSSPLYITFMLRPAIYLLLRSRLLRLLVISVFVPFASAQTVYPPETKAIPIPQMEDLPLADGPFKGTVESLKQYQCPDWFRDGKFGIWAHWGPQAVPGDGDKIP